VWAATLFICHLLFSISIFHLSLIIWRLPVHWIVAQNRTHWQEIANDKWQMENGKWKMANGKWKMGNGQSRLFCLPNLTLQTNLSVEASSFQG
jgi:hypothetical protein